MASSNVKVDIEEIMEEIRAQIRREQAENVDVGQIMREIRAQLKDAPKEAVPAFSEVTNAPVPVSAANIAYSKNAIQDDNGIVQQISNEAQYLKGSAYYPYYWEMGKGPKGFAKRVVRKLNKCILLPIHDHQNDFNLHTANGIDALRIGSEYHQLQLNQLEAERVEQRIQLGGLAGRIEAQQRDIEQLGGLTDRIEAQQRDIDQKQEEIDLRESRNFEALDTRVQEMEKRLSQLQFEVAAHGEAIGGQRREIEAGNAKLRDLRHSQDIQRMALEAQQRELTSQRGALDDFSGQLQSQRGALDDLGGQLQSQRGALDDFGGQLQSQRGALDDFGGQLQSQRGILDTYAGQMEMIREGIADHGRSLEGQRIQLNSHQKAVDQMSGAVQRHEQSLAAIDRSIDEMSLSVARTIRHYLSAQSSQGEVSQGAYTLTSSNDGVKATEAVPAATEKVQDDYEILDYFQFENHFRGTQSEIIERQKAYLPYFRNRKGKVFDFGCGRGEFLRLLKEAGIPAYGMDMYEEYRITGQLYGVDIETGDAFTALEQAEEPLGGIFCAQVIEHIGFKNIQKLCKLAYDKLEEGAYLILETPNPMCVSTFANFFYLDPTHDKPVHPLMMEYLLKSIGFSEIQLLWPDHSLEPLPKIRGDGIENLDEVNRAIERVSNLLFGSQDYAVVARK